MPSEQESSPPSSSTSNFQAAAPVGSSSPRTDQERVLRWQLSFRTNSHPSKDDKTEADLVADLDLHLGVDQQGNRRYELIKLKTKG